MKEKSFHDFMRERDKREYAGCVCAVQCAGEGLGAVKKVAKLISSPIILYMYSDDTAQPQFP